jgi:hypothetical protein
VSVLLFFTRVFLILVVLAVGGSVLGGVGAIELSVALVLSIIGAWTWTFWGRRGQRPVDNRTRARQ